MGDFHPVLEDSEAAVNAHFHKAQAMRYPMQYLVQYPVQHLVQCLVQYLVQYPMQYTAPVMYTLQ